MKVSHDFFPGIRYKAIERNNTILEGKVSQEICVCLFEGLFKWRKTGGDRTGTSGGDTQRAEQTRTTQSAGNKHGAQQ